MTKNFDEVIVPDMSEARNCYNMTLTTDERASSQGSQGAKGAKDLALGKAKMPRD